MTLIFLVGSNPSNWLSNSNIVRCTSESPPPLPLLLLELPIESISSMNIILGACSRPSLRKPVGQFCWEELYAVCKSQSAERLGLLLSECWHQFLGPCRRLSRYMIRSCIKLEFSTELLTIFAWKWTCSFKLHLQPYLSLNACGLATKFSGKKKEKFRIKVSFAV